MEDVTAIAARLRQAREESGFVDAAAASKAFGFTYSTYAGHENGSRGIKRDALLRYSKAYKVSVEWLLSGRGLKNAKRLDFEIGGETFYPVPIYDVRAAAGAGALVEDGEPATYQLFREGWLRTLTTASLDLLSGITVSGDSMEPALRNGDQILVDRSYKKVRGEGIYVILVDDVLQVKRLQRSPKDGILEVMSDNPAYKSYRLETGEESNVHIIGRVLWFARGLV